MTTIRHSADIFFMKRLLHFTLPNDLYTIQTSTYFSLKNFGTLSNDRNSFLWPNMSLHPNK